uniref:EF-hand domain-containing protein n=1 Tax=Paramoeba aestuarina TaxID=180227 RepID=A0A7S4K1C0_9EUKA|mmetsp:Transcript_14724/g.23007  ORF Transcript_14724/g.23007 Transcript_14724/m.23007 type:complete len:175 (+) Transcript_14724:158-682(+)|eukprot:CAMPEP_0201510672 /NCGR_PEP_ID=MMETSP0161_2-20130828/3254_1 /ASSEMBLY_ACC=CAM_ASM_000251 /TAXON_ID=180227 /ORGANISM="Neoparamoeba aestuarina, Strain SoJaBio B1-5/56/2" /LENGTH=174 /DNA_ID=CAMNT_0047905875 /DNA_START=174 /DNA_END=698 /DNA_ORIENTATION=+
MGDQKTFDETVVVTKIKFGKFFPEEDWKLLVAKFQEIDSSKNGYLSLEELKKSQESMQNALTHAELKQLLNELAVENPAAGLSFCEFMKLQLLLIGISADEISKREELAAGATVAVEGKKTMEIKKLELGREEDKNAASKERREKRDEFKQNFALFGDLITPRGMITPRFSQVR